MANYNMHAFQRMALVAAIDPASISASTVYTDVFDIGALPFQRYVAWVIVGTIGSSATVDFKFQLASTSGGTYYDVDATNCKITQIATSTKRASLEFMGEAIQGGNYGTKGTGFTFCRGALTIGTAATGACVVVFGLDPRFYGAETYNVTSVVENKVYIA